MHYDFDIIVIGAGAAGLNVASFMNAAGSKVLLIERDESRIGGDCLNFGCIPSKALIHVARKVWAAREAGQYGLSTTGMVDMKAVRSHIEGAQETIREHESADYFREKGMTVAIGEASFTGEQSVMVAGKEYTAKKIVLAVGARSRELSLPGIQDASVHTNETIFSLKHLPHRLVVIGGGPIGVELGQAFLMLGTQVSVVTRDSRILMREDEQVADILARRLEAQGMQFFYNASPKKFEGRTRLIVELAGGLEHQIGYDECLVAIGREFNFDSLQLSRAGVKTDQHGKLFVNEYLETTNSNVLVVGDAVGQHQFTHAAEVHAALVLRNLFKPKWLRKKLNTDAMGWVTFTTPEVATFGLSAQQLTDRKGEFETLEVPFVHEDRAITDDNQDGLLKLHVDAKGRVLGGTMVADGAGELVGELMLAQKHGLTLAQLFERVYPYPTAGRINRLAAQRFLSRQFTDRNKKLLQKLFHYFG